MMKSTAEFKDKILLILGHGSSIHPDSSRSVRKHAEVMAESGLFRQVYSAFLKEDLLVEDALDHILAEHAHADVVVVLDFLAEGYFTKQVIPKLLRLSERSSNIYVSQPVGLNPAMQELLAEAAVAELGDWKPEETSLLLVGHGSTKNAKSKRTMLEHMEELRTMTDFAEIADLWLEEAPFVTEWESVCSSKQVIAIPFLLSDGQHGGWDIPEELGIQKGMPVHGITHELAGRKLRMAPSLGALENFTKVIIPAALAARQLAPAEERTCCLYREICNPQAAAECRAAGCPRLEEVAL